MDVLLRSTNYGLVGECWSLALVDLGSGNSYIVLVVLGWWWGVVAYSNLCHPTWQHVHLSSCGYVLPHTMLRLDAFDVWADDGNVSVDLHHSLCLYGYSINCIHTDYFRALFKQLSDNLGQKSSILTHLCANEINCFLDKISVVLQPELLIDGLSTVFPWGAGRRTLHFLLESFGDLLWIFETFDVVFLVFY